jgi:hypothetical protein
MTSFTPRNLLTATFALLATTLVLASSASAGVLQTSGAERPWNQEWASWSCADQSRFQEVGAPAAEGQKAYKLTVQDGDNAWGERCELGDGNPGRSGYPLFHEGDERWISFQVYLPDNYPIDTPDWNVMFQIHQEGDGGCPPLALHVEDGQFKLFNSSSKNYVFDTVEKWHAPAQRNRWAKFTIHMMNSTDDNTGFVEMFGDLDGQGEKLLMPKEYMHTMTVDKDTGRPMTNHARIGIYRNPKIQGTSSIFFDNFTIATDRASAENAAFGGVPEVTPPQPVTPAPTPAPPVQPAPARRIHRVVLRSKHRRHTTVRSSGRWPQIVPVYGWVKNGRVGRRSVIIEIREHGRWQWLSRGALRSNGRFYLTPSIDPSVHGRVVLRAHVQGVGYSKPLSARV